MYEYIKGTLAVINPTYAVVEAAGIGYMINISLQTFSQIEKCDTIQLYVHHYFIQNEMPVMYGFATAQERELFRLLVSVSGIGANTARIMLSSFASTVELAGAIATGNVTAIKSVKGIGIKTAERTILELKGKVLNLAGVEPQSDGQLHIATVSSASLSEAVEALLVLGFSKVAVEKVAKAVYKDNPTAAADEIIRHCLSRL